MALATYEADPNPHEILHVKCYVIKFIRDQIENIKGKEPGTKRPMKPLPATPSEQGAEPLAIREDGEPPCKNWGWLHLLTLFLLMLLLFMYGAIVGANFCQAKRYGCHPLFPVLGLGKNGHDVVF